MNTPGGGACDVSIGSFPSLSRVSVFVVCRSVCAVCVYCVCVCCASTSHVLTAYVLCCVHQQTSYVFIVCVYQQTSHMFTVCVCVCVCVVHRHLTCSLHMCCVVCINRRLIYPLCVRIDISCVHCVYVCTVCVSSVCVCA